MVKSNQQLVLYINAKSLAYNDFILTVFRARINCLPLILRFQYEIQILVTTTLKENGLRNSISHPKVHLNSSFIHVIKSNILRAIRNCNLKVFS